MGPEVNEEAGLAVDHFTDRFSRESRRRLVDGLAQHRHAVTSRRTNTTAAAVAATAT
jgi:hypothetical protein